MPLQKDGTKLSVKYLIQEFILKFKKSRLHKQFKLFLLKKTKRILWNAIVFLKFR
jgi:hypothetical protein